MPTPDVAGIHIATPVFDGAHEKDVFETLEIAGRPEMVKQYCTMVVLVNLWITT